MYIYRYLGTFIMKAVYSLNICKPSFQDRKSVV